MCKRSRFPPLVLLALACPLAAASVGSAGAQQSTDPAAWFASLLQPNVRLPQFTTAARREFLRADLDRDGVVGQADARIEEENWASYLRRSARDELMAHDLDFDGVITREEAYRVESERVRSRDYLSSQPPADERELQRRIEIAVATVMRADRNGDSRIDRDEVTAFVQETPIRPNDWQRPGMIAVIRAMDEDGDGGTTPAEFERTIARLFASIDRDGDGVLSKGEVDAFRAGLEAERRAYWERLRQERAKEEEDARRAACALAKPSDAARVVLLGGYGGDALSTVAIGSQDIAVASGEIRVEPAVAPLYLIVSSSTPTIWRITGAAERLERLVLAGGQTGANETNTHAQPLIGATGVAAERVTFLGRPDCFERFVAASDPAAHNAAATIARQIGREPERLGAGSKVARINVPSGGIERRSDAEQVELTIHENDGAIKIERGAAPVRREGRDLQHRLRAFHSGGIVEIDPATVVASRPAEPYRILPEEAGLLQLVQSGALVPVDPVDDDPRRPPEYQVLRRIHLPAGLHGAQLVKFDVRRGVPTPLGDPGHSCVVLEDFAHPIANGSSCR